VVDDARAPRSFDPLAHGGHTAAGLAGHDDHPHLAAAERPAGVGVLARDLGQPQRIRRRAADHGRAGGVHRRQAHAARHAPAGHAERANPPPGLERRPEAEERAERDSAFVVNGSAVRSSGSRSAAGSTPAAFSFRV
jgi:hypothetical protein